MKKNILLLAFMCFTISGIGQKKAKKYAKIDSIKVRKAKKLDISLKGLQLLCNYYQLLNYTDSAYTTINKYITSSKLQKDNTHYTKGLAIKGVYFAKLSRFDSAKYYLKKVSTYPDVKFKIQQEAINNIAVTYRIEGKTDSAMVYMKKALALAKKEKYMPGILNTYLGLSNISFKKGKFYDRLAYIDSALTIVKKSPKTHYTKTVTILHKLGNINHELKNLKKSKHYYLQALDTCNFHKDNFVSFYVNNSLAEIYLEENKPDSAMVYLKNNLNHVSFGKNKDIFLNTYRRLFQLEFQKKEYTKAMFYNNISMKDAPPNSRHKQIANYQRAKILTAQNKYANALKYLSKINEKDIENLELKKDVYKTKYDVYFALGNANKAKNYLEKYLKHKDSLFSTNRALILNTLDIKYQTQQRKNEILKLKTQTQEKELTIQKSKTKTNYALGSLFLIVISSGFYLKKRKKDQKLKLLETAVKSSEREKIRIGKELHDGIAGKIMQLVHKTETKDVALSHELLDSYNNIRNLSHQLNNTPMHGELFMDRVFEIVPENKANQNFDLTLDPPYLELKEPHSTHLYRITQELFTNNLKYAHATKTNIKISLKDAVLTLNYSDDGIGKQEFKKGTGLKNIEDRVTLLKGNVKIESEDGFKVAIKIPYTS